MIGKIMIGKSFRGCLLYCLRDKEMDGQTVIKERAEVLSYNQCYGHEKDLIQQFNEVRLLNQKVSKPVLHITLSLAPGEHLGKDKLALIAEACAKELGFQNNQYIAVGHKDTDHQHLHIVANRIGFDARAVSDSNSYKKIALFCRKMEAQYDLQQVLSPKRYLNKEQQQLPRLDQRKEELKKHIKQSLAGCTSYSRFEMEMKALGYQVIKGRGISFLDSKGVKVKGSDVGYSLMRIEKSLAQNSMQQRIKTENDNLSTSRERDSTRSQDEKIPLQKLGQTVPEKQPGHDLNQALDLLLSPEKASEALNPELLKKKRKV